MPAEMKTSTAPSAEATSPTSQTAQQVNTPTKQKKSTHTSGRAALARVTLLDGSILDVTIDRKAKGKDLLIAICAGLDILETDYFGLIYSTPVDPRVWLDLEKPVSRFFKSDPWVLQFAVKFYPPEPAQLQEDITRYHLCLQVRNDILEGRLPCSFVTHALLGSYLVQSQFGDFDPKEMKDRSYLKDFRIAPNQTPELEDKVMDLHKTHKGQTPAEAELHYLENAKKIMMYGVDLHPAKDSEGVDILLGVCASGILVYREKLQINRFAWPKILKISYKRNNFYIKIRPGDFELYESTIGFRFTNYRSAKKFWKSCVEHHTFFRLLTPEPPAKTGLFPRLGSKFRYSGRTLYETRKNPVDRPAPQFNRSLTGKRLTSRSMDALALEKEKDNEAKKRHTMPNPPEHIPELESPRHTRSPLKKDKKEKKPTGGVAVLPVSDKSKKDKIKDKDEKDKEKEKLYKEADIVNGNDAEAENEIRAKPSDEKTPTGKRVIGMGSLFSSGRKSKDKSPPKEKEKVSPTKDKKSKDKEKQKDKNAGSPVKGGKADDSGEKHKIAIAVAETIGDSPSDNDKRKSATKSVDDKGFTRPYEYSETGPELSPSRKSYTTGGFRYDKDPKQLSGGKRAQDGNEQLSPNSQQKRATGLAFNYAPGEDEHLKEQAQKIKAGELSPRTREKLNKGELSPKTREKLLKEGNLSPKTKAKLMTPPGQYATSGTAPLTDVHGKSYSPNTGRAYQSGVPGTYKSIADESKVDPNVAFLDGERYGKDLTPTHSGKAKSIPPPVIVDAKKIDSKKPAKEPTSPIKPSSPTKISQATTPKDAAKAFIPAAVAASVGAGAATTAQPKKKRVKIMVIISKFDPKTKRILAEQGDIEHSTGILDTEKGTIESKYGLIDPKNGTIEALNTKTGKNEVYKGHIDPKTGNLHITNGVANPESGKVDDSLGQIVCIGPQENPIVELTVITSRIDPNTKKVDTVNGEVELSLGVLDLNTGVIDTKYGEINPKTGEIKTIDSKSGKLVVSKNVGVDPKSGQITLIGVPDAKTGKIDQNQGRLIEVGQQIDPIVEVTAISGKLDNKKGIIDPKTAQIDSSAGQIDLKTSKIDTKYGQIDLIKHTVTSVDPKSGKTLVKDIKVDPHTGQVILKDQINPKTGKTDKDYGRIVSLRIVQTRLDPKTNKPQSKSIEKDIIVDPKTNQIWVATGGKDPQTKESIYASSNVDPKTGYVITIYGYLDPKSNDIKKQTKVDPNLIKIEPQTGKVFTATGDIDEKTGEPLYAATQTDPVSGEIYTKVGRYDPKTGKIILVKIFLVNKIDERGRPQEIDPNTCDIDPESGRINKIFNKTVYVYNMVDPITGEIVQVDPNDPRVAGARTTVTQTMTLSGEIDPVTGYIKTEYGHIDPVTGDIDPSTAVHDPVTGKLILNYAHIDPSHFGKEVTVVKETVPITRDQFFEGIKHVGKNALRRDSEASSDDDMAQYGTETIKEMQSGTPAKTSAAATTTASKFPGAPTVVKTTTKQVLTKNEDGVTHNVEEEIRNLGTGEVTFSTQEHKADVPRDDLNNSSGAYMTATAVTTRTAMTHEDLNKNAKTEQLEEKTVATTRTHDPSKQQQRVVTQEVKTTSTVTSGEQFQRRDSVSSSSSGDSGTPIDGPYDNSYTTHESEQAQSHPSSTFPHVESTRVVIGEETPTYSAHGEIVSSQTVSSKTRTVETITYKTERDGIVETRVEQKITIQSDGDPIDHDKALAEAIQEATAMNPDMTVEKIEIQQQTQ